MEHKLVILPNQGPIFPKGGINGPILTPYREEIKTIGVLLMRGYTVTEVLPNDVLVELNMVNFDKDNGGEQPAPAPAPAPEQTDVQPDAERLAAEQSAKEEAERLAAEAEAIAAAGRIAAAEEAAKAEAEKAASLKVEKPQQQKNQHKNNHKQHQHADAVNKK